MYMNTLFIFASAVLSASQAMSASITSRGSLIATDPCAFFQPSLQVNQSILTFSSEDAACNCPNNCGHEVNDSCKYYQPDSSDLVTGGKSLDDKVCVAVS